jgi:MFS family permease
VVVTTTAPVPAPPEPARFRDLLGDRVFGPFFFANALSNTGNWFQNVAAGILVFELTGSSTAVGFVAVLQFATTMLLTPWAGGLTDRVNRQRMLLLGQAIALVGAAGLAAWVLTVGVDGLTGPAPVYVATAVIGLGVGIVLPSLQAVVPALVERADLDRAITLNSMTFNIARGIGPVAAGLVVGAFGAGVAFGVNAVSFVPLLLVLLVLRPRGSVEPRPGADGGSVRESLRWVRARPAVGALLLATLAVGWTSDPFTTLMPAVADALGRDGSTVGLLVGAYGSGAALVAPFVGRIRERLGRGRVIAVGLGTVATGLVVLASATTLPVALVGCVVSGAGFLFGVTSTNTELQRGIPDDRRGRIMAFWSVAFLGCRPLAATAHGALADLTSVRTALLTVAGIGVVAAVLVWRSRPTGDDVRDEDEALAVAAD